MTLFPITSPRLGLSITTDSACLVEIHRKWGRKTFRRLVHHPLPDGLVKLSSGKLNIADPNTLSDTLRALTKAYKKPQPIVLSLPDVSCRTAIFEFTSFPKKPAERNAILNWRFQQDLNLPTQKARIGFRLFETSRRIKAKQPALTKVLATAVPNTIIEQYESACLKAGLLPLGVGLSSLDVLDLLVSKIRESAQVTSRRSQHSGKNSLFLYIAGWGFSFIALKESYPAFVRVKSLKLAHPQEPSLESVQPALTNQIQTTTAELPPLTDSKPHLHQSMPQTQPPQKPTGIAKMFRNELVATLQYYLESIQSTSWVGQTLPLYIAEGLEDSAALLPAIQEIEQMLRASIVDAPSLALHSFSESLRNSFPKDETPTPQTYPKALPAYASVMVSS